MKKINLPLKKIKEILEEQLKKGTTPSKISLAITLGLILGIVPFPGINTALCFFLAWRLKLNVAILQLINYVAFPLQILLFIPYIKIATAISGITSNFPLDKLWEMISNHPAQIINNVFTLLLQGVILWFVTAIPLYFICYYFFKRLLMNKKILTNNTSTTV